MIYIEMMQREVNKNLLPSVVTLSFSFTIGFYPTDLCPISYKLRKRIEK